MMSHERRLTWLTLLSGAPAVVVCAALLVIGHSSAKVMLTLAVVVLVPWVLLALAARDEAVQPLRVLANLLLSLREGDFTVRGRHRRNDTAGLAMREVNALAQLLHDQRSQTLEATALLGKVLEEIDIAIIAVDAHNQPRMLNPAAERFLREHREDLAALLAGEPVRLVGTWELRRREFRQNGEPHRLLVLTDLRRALREEERQAWRRMVRVLGHEIGNSLAPIHSLAGTLRTLKHTGDWEDRMRRGLEVIERRADGLNRFMQAYTRLSRLPPPNLAPVDLGEHVRRVVGLEQRLPVVLVEGPLVQVLADGDQLDQVLINILANAVDAAAETGGGVRVTWAADGSVCIDDEGPGIADASNLFVPFFTTKANGSGIGLALCRQIVDAHRGSLTLTNRRDRSGCSARIALERMAP